MTIADIYMYNTKIGTVSLRDGQEIAEFEYDASFAKSGIELSPLMMPLMANTIYRFPMLNMDSFFGLPGMLADSLPDSFGQALIETWLARQGRVNSSLNAVERLCYTGVRGMGALEFRPSIGPSEINDPLDIDALVELASEIMKHREEVSVTYQNEFIEEEALAQIMQIGTSAGGARAKAIIAWNKKTHEIKSGQINAGKGFEYYLIKFDGIKNNRDKESADKQGYTNVEYAYHLMAKDAGVEMSHCELLKDGKLSHFITKRFDRDENGGKIHMQTLAGMAHYDFKQLGVNSYEQIFQILRRLNLGAKAAEQMFLRMVFNVYAVNHDDHVKNTSFLMDREGNWSLSPAYDITYSHNPHGKWTSNHQLMINGKRNGISRTDLIACAVNNEMKEARANMLIDQVMEVVDCWKEYASKACVSQVRSNQIWEDILETRAVLES